MTAAEHRSDSRWTSAQRVLGKLAGHIGGFLTGLGVAYLMVTWATWRLRNASEPLPAFLIALAIVLAVFLVVRRRPPLKGVGAAAKLGDLARVTLPWVFGFMLLATFLRRIGTSYDHHVYRGAMKSDLRNLQDKQAEIHGSSGKYVTDSNRFVASTGISKPDIRLTADGWHAFVTYARIGRRCGIYVGTRPAGVPMTIEGEPACDIIGGVPFRWDEAWTAFRIIALGIVVGIAGSAVVRRVSGIETGTN